MSNTNSDSQNSSSIKYYENNFNYLDRYQLQENHKFGRGHIIRQYMSSVGVITERYISNDHLLFFKSENPSDQSMSNYYVKSLENVIGGEEEEEEEEEKTITTMPVNCPCYEKAFEEELKKNISYKNIFLSMFQTFKSEITKLLRLDLYYKQSNITN